MAVRLDSVVGQPHVVEALRRRIDQNQLPHAMLFNGPDGVGKRTTAEAVAARLLCETPEAGNACGRCRACAMVNAQAHPDLIRTAVNLKGNILLGDPSKADFAGSVRWMEQQLYLRAHGGRAKVAVVDEAHRMRGEAQQALLKTLEEPPGRSHLILVSSQPDKLLPTVLSRCQRIQFRPLSRKEVKEVVKHRRPALGDEAVQALADLAEGAPGQALALDFDALMERRDLVTELDERIDASRAEAPMEAISRAPELAKERTSLCELLDAWALWSRDQVLVAAGLDSERLAHPDQVELLLRLANRRGLVGVLARSDAILEARRQLDLPFNLNAIMVTEQLLLTLAGRLPLRRIPFHPNVARNP